MGATWASKKLKATKPSNYKGKVSEETEDIIIKKGTKLTRT